MNIVAIGGATLGSHLAKLALRLLGFNGVGFLFPWAEPLLQAAGILFGASTSTLSGVLFDIVTKYAVSATISGTGVLLLGTGSVLTGFAVKAIVFLVKTSAGLVYLTVDMAIKGTSKVVKYAYDSLPAVSPPPARWEIQENYMPENRARVYSPEPKQLSFSSARTVPIDNSEIELLAGHDPEFSKSFIHCTDEQISAILGRSHTSNSKSPQETLPKHPLHNHHPQVGSHHSASQPVSPYRSIQNKQQEKHSTPNLPNYNIPKESDVSNKPSSSDDKNQTTQEAAPTNDYPFATVSDDALSGFLIQSAKQLQQSGYLNNSKDEEIEKFLLSHGTEWLPPPGAGPLYASRKLEQSINMHASTLRKADPVVDNWMEVSAPPMDDE